MSAVIIRILLRYLSGLLIAKGLLAQDMGDMFNDPDLIASLQVAAGAIVGAATEGWYYLAHRFGWAK